MVIHEFGNENERVMLMFPCAAEPWDAFEDAAKLLAARYRVVLVTPDGHTPGEGTDFVSVEKTVDDAVAWLKAHGIVRLDALYGMSMGGGMAMHLLAWDKFPVKRVLIDAGTAPYTYPKWVCKLIGVRDYLEMKLAVRSRRVTEAAFPPERFTPEGCDPVQVYDGVMAFLRTLSNKTIWNVFWSANNYSVPDTPRGRAELLFWVGADEWSSRFRDLKWARGYFPNMRVRTIPRMMHGEYVMIHPKDFVQDALAYFEDGATQEDEEEKR